MLLYVPPIFGTVFIVFYSIIYVNLNFLCNVQNVDFFKLYITIQRP